MIEPDEETQEWFDRVAETLPTLIGKSAATMHISPDIPDPKCAVELGYTLLLDKPLIVIRMNGRTVPPRLARAADAVIDWSDDTAVMAERIRDALLLVEKLA